MYYYKILKNLRPWKIIKSNIFKVRTEEVGLAQIFEQTK